MTPLAHHLARVAADLDACGARFALVGGLAVSVRTEPRFTRDIDLAVAVADDADAERVILELRRRGLRPFSHLEQEAAGRLATVRLASGADPGVIVDLLFASSGVEAEVVAAAQPLDVFAGVVVPVATVGHLLALKALSGDSDSRPQDVADARALAAVASDGDRDVARRTARLIEERGYARGRDLGRALEELLG